MNDEAIGFDQIIAPLTRERFLSEFWNRSFLHLKGVGGRFTPLLPWDELNAILEWHCPPQPQLRLFQEGKQVDVRRYIDGQAGAFRLNAGGLIAALSQGATLVLDSVQEVAPRVQRLADSLQDILEGNVHVNLYAGWRKQTGFDLHWDAQELIVLQLSGRKHWKIYEPTRLHPLLDDVETPTRPDEQPVWDGIIEDGDVLHVPRGWWHVAYPLDEPSLHLTFSVEPPNGADFLRWWVRRMLRNPEARENLPRGNDAPARQEYLMRLLTLTKEGWGSDRDSVREFLAERNANRRLRPHVRLPFAPIEQQKPMDMSTHIRLAVSQGLTMEFEPGNAMARLRANGRSWSFDPALVPILEQLSPTAVPLGTLCSGIPDQGVVGLLMQALSVLAEAGVIFKEAPPGAS